MSENNNGKEFKFEEASYEEFLAHFATVEERVAYLEELERKMEFIRKQDQIASRKRFEQLEQNEYNSQKRFERIEKHLAHITQLTGIVFEDLEFIGDQAEEISQRLQRNKQR